MNRIEQKLSSLAAKGEKALALFLTAGYPNINSTVGLVISFEEAGADIIELGMPFSDPLADGPVIQQSSSVALKNGVTLNTTFEYIRAIRTQSAIPLVLMGYLNPILSFGVEKFFSSAAESGIDGIVLPELPLEEAGKFKSMMEGSGLSQILLVTPTSPPERIEAIDAASSGFLYCVSTTGVTGERGRFPSHEYVRNVKRHARKNPVLVGFGISSPDDAKRYSRDADGVIVGSALIKKIGEGGTAAELSPWVREMKEVLR